MDTLSRTRIVSVQAEATASRGRVGTYAELLKPRLSGLVVVTSGMGYLLASGAVVDWMALLALVTGTFLLSGGACAMNMWIEAEQDARMHRTRSRPIPSGRLGGRAVALFALAVSVAGFALLLRRSGPATATLGVLSWAVYVAAYTPLKRFTTLCTPVGALVGAIPPVMGWVAATGRIDSGALVLAAILFVWQIPHFLAIAWLYREDYARSGFKMLPVVEPDGESTFRMVLLYSLALLPVTLLAAPIRPTGWLYPLGAVALGAGFILLAVRLYRSRSRSAARRLFLASLLYLPLIFCLMVFDPTGPGGVR